MSQSLLLGLAMGLLIGTLGFRARFLSVSGAIAVFLITLFSFAAGGWLWGAIPALAFASIGLLARYRATEKRRLGARFREQATRDWERIIARAGWGVALTALQVVVPKNLGLFAAFLGAYATANADAWATELGVLSSQPPVLITTRRQVSPGTPGAISIVGLMAALGASWLMGLSGLLLTTVRAWLDKSAVARAALWLPFAAMVGGMAGSLTDSLLGATAQALYYCEACDEWSETRIHSCGQAATQTRGWPWLTNDGVNLVSSVIGAAAAAATLAWLARNSI